MELTQLFHQLKKRFKLIVFFSLVLAICFAFLAKTWLPHYVASLSLYVHKPTQPATSGEYSFDGYYALQVAENYTDTLVGLLESPDILAAALSNLGKDSVDGLGKYNRAIQVEKIAPLLISLRVSLKDKQEATSLVNAVAQSAQKQVRQLNNQQDLSIEVELVDTDPLVSYQEISALIAGIVGLMLGLGMTISGIFLSEYLRLPHVKI